jgi:hypothetical protein
MRLWILFGVCLLLLYLRPRIREHLEPTDAIRAPISEVGRSPEYPPDERDRMWSLMPLDVQRRYQGLSGSTLSGKVSLAVDVADFYSTVYASTTGPITLSQIAEWVSVRYPEKPATQNELSVKALKTYFIDQAPPPPPPPPTPPVTIGSVDGTDITGPTGGTESPPPPADLMEVPEPVHSMRTDIGAPVTVTVEVNQPRTRRPFKEIHQTQE